MKASWAYKYVLIPITFLLFLTSTIAFAQVAENKTAKKAMRFSHFLYWPSGSVFNEFQNPGPVILINEIFKQFGTALTFSHENPNIIFYFKNNLKKTVQEDQDKELYRILNYFYNADKIKIRYFHSIYASMLKTNATCYVLTTEDPNTKAIRKLLILLERNHSDYKKSVCFMKAILQGMGLQEDDFMKGDFYEDKKTNAVLVRERVYKTLEKLCGFGPGYWWEVQ